MYIYIYIIYVTYICSLFNSTDYFWKIFVSKLATISIHIYQYDGIKMKLLYFKKIIWLTLMRFHIGINLTDNTCVRIKSIKFEEFLILISDCSLNVQIWGNGFCNNRQHVVNGCCHVHQFYYSMLIIHINGLTK